MKSTVKKVLFTLFALSTISFLTSCSSDSESIDNSTSNSVASATAQTYSHSSFELELLDLVNEYRVNQGLNALTIIEHISYVSGEHSDYMIYENQVSHDNFSQRKTNMQQVLGAIRVGENVAFGYSTATAALNAWIQSDSHRANLEGDYTHFGISVKNNSEGKKFYTNMFIKQ